jgi:hypothetical protein
MMVFFDCEKVAGVVASNPAILLLLIRWRAFHSSFVDLGHW